jgi:hypothetical protein
VGLAKYREALESASNSQLYSSFRISRYQCSHSRLLAAACELSNEMKPVSMSTDIDKARESSFTRLLHIRQWSDWASSDLFPGQNSECQPISRLQISETCDPFSPLHTSATRWIPCCYSAVKECSGCRICRCFTMADRHDAGLQSHLSGPQEHPRWQ